MTNHTNLDNEELLRLALDASGRGNAADAVSMLKTLVERDPANMFAHYLLAAEHAQLGLMDRAEAGFLRAVDLAPDFPMARFQLGQLLFLKGENAGGEQVLVPLAQRQDDDALPAYARAMIAAANEDVAEAVAQLQAGLARKQEIPALADDMQRLLERLRALLGSEPPATIATPASAAPLFLSNYGKSQD